eukprot:jgi/Tetstr1/461675/TSEL_006775.t1
MFREFVTRMMLKSSGPGVRAGLCWENVTHLLRVAEAEARTIPVAEEQVQDDIWTCGWRVLFFIYCLLKLKPEDERRAALLSAGTCREFSTTALESFRNNVVQQRSAQDGVIDAPTDTDIVPIDLCARVDKPEDGLRPFTPWAARRIAQVRGWESVSMGATVALMETVLNQDPSSLIQQEAAAGKAPERAVILPPEDMLDIAEHTQGWWPYVGEKEGKVDPWKLWQLGKECARDLGRQKAESDEEITHIDGQAPNLQAILACTCHCRPTEVYRGPEIRELPNFITSHKNLMQPLGGLWSVAWVSPRRRELRLVAEAAAPAAAAAASIPP